MRHPFLRRSQRARNPNPVISSNSRRRPFMEIALKSYQAVLDPNKPLATWRFPVPAAAVAARGPRRRRTRTRIYRGGNLRRWSLPQALDRLRIRGPFRHQWPTTETTGAGSTRSESSLAASSLNFCAVTDQERNEADHLIRMSVDQCEGRQRPCGWIEFFQRGLPGGTVSAARLSGTREKSLVRPDGWKFENSLSHSFQFLPGTKLNENFEFVRH